MPNGWRATCAPGGAKAESHQEDYRSGTGPLPPAVRKSWQATGPKTRPKESSSGPKSGRIKQPGVLKVQKYADDTTVRLQKALRSKRPEAEERGPGKKEKNKWTYIQTIRTGTGGAGTGLKVMFDSRATHTLILHTAAARAALAPSRQEKWVMSPDSGKWRKARVDTPFR